MYAVSVTVGISHQVAGCFDEYQFVLGKILRRLSANQVGVADYGNQTRFSRWVRRFAVAIAIAIAGPRLCAADRACYDQCRQQ